MKKVLALTLVLVLALSMSTIAFAATYTYDRNSWGTTLSFGDTTGALIADNTIDGVVVGNINNRYSRTDVSFIGITVAANGSYVAAGTVGVTKPLTNNLDAKITFSKGSNVYDDYKVNPDGSITVKFIENVLTAKDIDFKYTISAVISGKAISSDAIKVEGTYEVDEVSTDNDWMDFSTYSVFKPTAFVREMEYMFSDDISVYGRALKNVLYKGKVSADPTDADEDLMYDHPQIVGVYHLSDINVSTVADHVVFNNDDASLFVYDGDLNLLGKVGDKNIPYATTYYLASSELSVDTDEEPDDFGDDEEYEPGDLGGNAGTGGDDLYPENPHDNPGTGK